MFLQKPAYGLLILLVFIGHSWGQSETEKKEEQVPSVPTSVNKKYEFRTDLWLSGMTTDIHGSKEKYFSDVNLRSGFQLENFRFEVRPAEGSSRCFDILNFQAQGLGDVEPYEKAQLTLRKNGRYDFRLLYTKNQYFFDVPGFAADAHSADNTRRTIGLDLRYYLRSDLSLRVGYQNYYRSGHTATTQEVFGTLFPLLQYHHGRTDHYKIGMDWKNRIIGVSIDQGFRSLRFDDRYSALASSGIDSGSVNQLSDLQKNAPLRGMIPETTISAKIQPSSRLDILSRYQYSKGDWDFSRYELQNLRIGASGMPLEQLALTQASINQPQHRYDLNATFDISPQWTLQNSFYVNRYKIQGDGLLTQTLRNKQSSVLLSEIDSEETDEYRRINNETMLQYTPTRLFRLHTTYRYAHRKFVDVSSENEETYRTENSTGIQSIMAGWSAGTGMRWKTSLEYEHSWTDTPLFWMEPLRLDRWRARGSLRPLAGWQIAGSWGWKDVKNDRKNLPQNTQDYRDFSLQITWTPRKDYLVDFHYGRTDLLSATDIVFQLATRTTDKSLYVTNMNFANFLFQMPIYKRMHGNFSYSILDDSAGSYPLVYHQTAAGLLLHLHGPLWMDMKWRYLAYNEELFHDRDYAGHLLAAGLRYGF